MKITKRTATGWTPKIENESKDHCDECKAKLFQAPHGGLYCDAVHEDIDQLYREVMDTLDEIDYQTEYENGTLERAMEYFCSNYDKGYGMRIAIESTLNDQYGNHKEDLMVEDLKHLLDILTNKNK